MSFARFHDSDVVDGLELHGDDDDFVRGDACQLAQLWLPLARAASSSLAVGDAHALLTCNAVSLACIAEQLVALDAVVRTLELALALAINVTDWCFFLLLCVFQVIEQKINRKRRALAT